jgi:hypothetical protein
MSTRTFISGGDYYLRSGLVFTSQEYDQGDVFIADHIYKHVDLLTDHWTKIRRLTNFGQVREVKISDYIPIISE